MNKNDLKKVVKERILNQKNAIQTKRPIEYKKEAEKFFEDHFPKQAEYHANEAAKHLEKWSTEFKREFCGIFDMHGMRTAMGYVNRSRDAAYALIEEALSDAAWGRDPFTATNRHHWLKESPMHDDFKEPCERMRLQFHQSLKDLSVLENELLSVITAAKSAKVAAEALKDLGIEMDIPEAKKVQSNLPAVVKLSVDANLFNKSVAKAN